MVFAIALTLVAIAGGAVLTYVYEKDAPFAARLCMGCCTGMAALGLVGFVAASFLGMTPSALGVSSAIIASPLLLLFKPSFLAEVQSDIKSVQNDIRRAILHPTAWSLSHFVFYVLISVLLYFVFDRAVVETAGAIYTGGSHNLGDLPFHFASITSFVYGQNFPPEDPSYAGTRFAYPFIADFVAAMFVRAGASMRNAMFLQNMALSLSLVGVLHRWTVKLTRDRLAGLIAPVLVLLSGGLGWKLFFEEVRTDERGIVGLLSNLRHDYSILDGNVYRWGNALTTLFITQRSILFGLPIAIIIFTQWWLALDEVSTGSDEGAGKRSKSKTVTPLSKQARPMLFVFPSYPFSASAKRMIAAGVMAGMLLLVHAHTFLTVMGLAGVLALIFFKHNWRDWTIFFAIALVLAVPQMVWVMSGSSVEAKSFIGWHFGWDKAEDANAVVFWFKNLGLFIPLLVGALLWKSKDYFIERKWLYFYLPFTLCFIGPNLIKLAPWPWDNIKVLFYWYIASVPIVALVLARTWQGKWYLKVMTVGLFASLTLAGALDVWRTVSKQIDNQEYEKNGVILAQKIIATTPPRSLILHAPTYNPVVFLTGRRSFLGYTGYIWAHGLDFVQRESDIKNIYAGASNAEELLSRHGVNYIVVTPVERSYMVVNDPFFTRFPLVAEAGEYKLYQVPAR
jgi:hypothetical protein